MIPQNRSVQDGEDIKRRNIKSLFERCESLMGKEFDQLKVKYANEIAEDPLLAEIVNNYDELMAHAKGNKTKLKVRVVHVEAIPEFSSEEIRALREEIGMTQSIFASVIGVNKSTVEKWERGINKPTGSAYRLMELLKEQDPCLKKIYVVG